MLTGLIAEVKKEKQRIWNVKGTLKTKVALISPLYGSLWNKASEFLTPCNTKITALHCRFQSSKLQIPQSLPSVNISSLCVGFSACPPHFTTLMVHHTPQANPNSDKHRYHDMHKKLIANCVSLTTTHAVRLLRTWVARVKVVHPPFC